GPGGGARARARAERRARRSAPPGAATKSGRGRARGGGVSKTVGHASGSGAAGASASPASSREGGRSGVGVMVVSVSSTRGGPDDRSLAVVDLGSNTFRLVVFRSRPGGPFHLVDEIRQTVRPAAGAEDGRLRPEAVDRAARTAALYAAFCRAGAIDEVDAVATSALREARNGPEATARLRGAGLPVRVISSEEEARYGVLGV